MRWARIENNEVREIVTHNPKGLYHPDLIFVECPDEVKERWTYTDGKFSAPPRPQEPTESMLALRALTQSDSTMIRVIDDIWTVLKNKGLVADDDLPVAAKEKLAARAELRKKL